MDLFHVLLDPLGSGNQQHKSGFEGVRRLVSGKKQKNEFSNDSELEFYVIVSFDLAIKHLKMT